jgi:hypothetical protein
MGSVILRLGNNLKRRSFLLFVQRQAFCHLPAVWYYAHLDGYFDDEGQRDGKDILGKVKDLRRDRVDVGHLLFFDPFYFLLQHSPQRKRILLNSTLLNPHSCPFQGVSIRWRDPSLDLLNFFKEKFVKLLCLFLVIQIKASFFQLCRWCPSAPDQLLCYSPV